MTGMLWRFAGNIVAGVPRPSRLVILMYHRVLARQDPFLPDDIDIEGFEEQVSLLSRDFQVLTLSEAVSALSRDRLPRRAAVITFDDGYRDNFELALPVLRKYGVPATFFIATGFLGGGRMWNDTLIEAIRVADDGLLDLSGPGLGRHVLETTADRVRTVASLVARLKYHDMRTRHELVSAVAERVGKPLPDNLMMERNQVRMLAANGMELGAHTRNHPILARLDIKDAEREIHDGRDDLCGISGEPVKLFAYPNGRPGRDYGDEHVKLLRRSGFDAAVSTRWGCATKESDLFQLPRIAPWDRTALRFRLRVLKAYREVAG